MLFIRGIYLLFSHLWENVGSLVINHAWMSLETYI